MTGRWKFLAAYGCSGLAALAYEVVWTRWLTLYMGHSTAAASTVFAAFMGGMGAGSAAIAHFAPRLSRRQALYAYAMLEAFVALAALAVPLALTASSPVLVWAYRDGAVGPLFPLVRLACCFVILVVPAAALGSTFPLAVRWFVPTGPRPGQLAGQLYAVNTFGAAIGTIAAGYFLIPAIGLNGTTLVGVAAGAISIALTLSTAKDAGDEASELTSQPPTSASGPRARVDRSGHGRGGRSASPALPETFWLAATVLALTGFATFMYEIAWTRVFAMIIGPSTYAIAATLTAFITGLAMGSLVGSRLAGRWLRPTLALSLALIGGAVAASLAAFEAGGPLLRFLVAHAGTADTFTAALWRHSLIVAALVAPTAVALGLAFPLSLQLAGGGHEPESRRLGTAYAINTLAAVAGALAAGFVAIPLVGLQQTLRVASALLLVGAAGVSVRSRFATRVRWKLLGLETAVVILVFVGPRWDRDLISSGMYMYARQIPQSLDVETALRAGTLLYYREGATATVSVRRLAGDISLAIDGKVDASTSGDMLTQKLLAHVPLLLHPDPRAVAIIGLGSGVTLASALVHPVASVDVVEISPEVVQASRYFSGANHHALDDARTRLIVGDGRSHLSLASRRYDVIISEPSNPWMAGVAALFTREFFEAARRRLAPGGIICQWAHTYDISDADLRSIVATFNSVFQNGAMWLVGDGDLLLVGSTEPTGVNLDNIAAAWNRQGVAADLAEVSVDDAFSILSMFIGGPQELRRYADGAALQTDDRMALEFSGPSALYAPAIRRENVSILRGLAREGSVPDAVARAMAAAGAAEWRHRGAMMFRAAAYDAAYDAYLTALRSDPGDGEALDGLVRSAVAVHRQADAMMTLRSFIEAHPRTIAIRVAASKLAAAGGSLTEATNLALDACQIEPVDPAALEQLASVYSDAGDVERLELAVDELQRRFPERAGSWYYAGAATFMRGQLPLALAQVTRAVALDPMRAAARNLEGAIQATRGDVVAARKAFEAALVLDARDSATYVNLGLLDLAAGNPSAAVSRFSEALVLDPGSTAAQQGLAESRSAPGGRAAK